MENGDLNLKKYKSAYIIFSIEQRKKMKAIDPKLDNRVATRLIGEEWRKLSAEEKEKYKKLEIGEKEKFNLMKEKKKYFYKKTENREPIRHRTPYMFFISEHKDKIKGDSRYQNIENIKHLSEIWKKMTPEEKSPYEKRALLDKERFKLEWENYIHHYMKKSKKTKGNINVYHKKLFKEILKPNKDDLFSNKPNIKGISEEASGRKTLTSNKFIKPTIFFIEKKRNRKKVLSPKAKIEEFKNVVEPKDIDDLIDESDEEKEEEEEEESISNLSEIYGDLMEESLEDPESN